MTDFNDFVEAFAGLVASKVASLLSSDNNWPNVEIKPQGINVEELIRIEDLKEKVHAQEVEEYEPSGLDEFVKQPDIDMPKIDVNPKSRRVSELMRINIRTLRRQVSAVEKKQPSDYSHLDKDELVDYIWKLEAVIGKTLDDIITEELIKGGLKTETPDIPDDTDFETPEPEDDTDPGTLTREQAETLDLASLKTLARKNDVPEDDLRGQDVEAVVELLFGKLEAPEPADGQSEAVLDEETEEVEITEEDAKNMSLGELKEVAKDYEIEFDRTIKRPQLLAKVLELFVEEEDD